MLVIRIWIAVIASSILMTMGIGAMTRLTGSGLSIVEWKPVSGVFPPRSDMQWSEEFQRYQQFPDFKSRPTMTLSEFKVIFWWEFIHRLVARSVLFIILLPYGVLWICRQLEKRHHKKVLGLLVLGAVQGFLGWFMVKSGLVQVPRVSHFRLMIHFLWACLILAYLARWLAEEVSTQRDSSGLFVQSLSWLCLGQMALGALVAGSRAGYIYNTFPKLGDTWLPQKFLFYPTLSENLFYNQINLQFFHRAGGWILFIAALMALGRRLYLISILIFTQFALGVATLVLMIPPVVATFHQLLGVLLFFYLRYLSHKPGFNGIQRSDYGFQFH